MGRLEITIKIAVNEKIDKKFPDEEIWLRAVAQEIKQIVGLVGRGKFDIETTLDRQKRRSSKRALKKEK